MDSLQKKGINFDLNTEKLKKHYPKENWNNAYYDVRSFLESHGFEHIQGSGYHSKEPLSEMEAMGVLYRMARKFQWLNYCVSVCTIADVPETFDISHVFVREAERLEKKQNEKL